MRELKFRGWATSCFVYFDIREDNDFNFYDFYSSCESNTIEQYTGLKDKNGKEIYEGDIVSMHTQYYTETFEIAWREDKAGWFGFAADDYTSPLCNIGYAVEVIGNIHENLELLENE